MNTFFRSQTTEENQPGKRKSIMQIQNQLTNAVAPLRNKLARPPWRWHLVLVMAFATGLAPLTISPVARASCAYCDPQYWNTGWGPYTTFEFLTSGTDNTAFGGVVLDGTSTGSFNTGIGSHALYSNVAGNYNTATGAYAFGQGDQNLDSNYSTADGAYALFSDVTGSYNTATGYAALISNTDGSNNTATGVQTLWDNTTGSYNTASGAYALFSNLSGTNNTATGSYALYYNTGSNNTATGDGALDNNTSGQNNTATGMQAMLGDLENKGTGSNNTATGYESLFSYSSGNYNTAMGVQSLFKDTSGGSNTATGYAALYLNTTGNFNTATGRGALYKNTGSDNTATGYQSLNLNGSGHDNVAYGMRALQNNTNGYSNVAVGTTALQNNTVGSNNIAVGTLAGYNLTTGSNNIDIGNQGTAGEAGIIRIGAAGTHTNTLIAGVYNVPVSGLSVVVGSGGQLGTSTSSARFKDDIKPMDKVSEAILSLQPVTFRYKKDLDPKAIPQFWLVAEQVEKVDRDLVARDAEGKPFSVRYEAVNAMLLNEFLKEHRTVAEQKTTIAQLQSGMARQQREIETLAATAREQAGLIQKVSAQMSITRPPPRLVVDNQ